MLKKSKNKMMTGGEKNVKDKYFFPGDQKTIEATSREEAEKKLKELKNKK